MEKIDLFEIEEKNLEIITNKFFSVRYLYLDAGRGMPVRKEQAMATIQVIEGRITFVYGKEEKACMMQQHAILEFDGRLTYSIIAHENSKILITIVPVNGKKS